MALEKIEEEFGLLAILRDAIHFYLSYLQERKAERETAIVELAEVPAQVEQMSLKKGQAEEELDGLLEKKDQIDQEYAGIASYVEILSKLKTIKEEVVEKRRKLQEREDALVAQEKIAKSKPADEIVQSDLVRAKAIFQGECSLEDLVLKRLNREHTRYSTQFGETGANAKEVEKQAQAIQGRLQKIEAAIDKKGRGVAAMDEFIKARQEKMTRLEELKDDLSRCEIDLSDAAQVAGIISEVPYDVQPVPATATESTS